MGICIVVKGEKSSLEPMLVSEEWSHLLAYDFG
jgi:hypothetical protein